MLRSISDGFHRSAIAQLRCVEDMYLKTTDQCATLGRGFKPIANQAPEAVLPFLLLTGQARCLAIKSDQRKKNA
jgi:hypothetical protein